MKKKNIIGILFIVIAVGAAVTLGIITKSGKLNKKEVQKVELYTVPESKKVYINGIIEPENYKDIYLDATKGTVDTTVVTNGQTVKAGDILFTYKNEQKTELIDTYNDNLESTRRKRNSVAAKMDKLKNESAGKAAINDLVSEYESTIIDLDSQISDLEEKISQERGKEASNVVSPIDGLVTVREAETNMTKPYITVESSILCVNGTVNEKDKIKLAEGKAVEIYIFGQKRTVTGKVLSIGTKPIDKAAELGSKAISGNSSVSNYEIKIAFDSQDNLINGFHVQATVLLNDGEIKIPTDSVISEEGKSYVFRDVDGEIEKVEVICGETGDDKVAILQGINEGDSIVEEPTADTKETITKEATEDNDESNTGESTDNMKDGTINDSNGNAQQSETSGATDDTKGGSKVE